MSNDQLKQGGYSSQLGQVRAKDAKSAQKFMLFLIFFVTIVQAVFN